MSDPRRPSTRPMTRRGFHRLGASLLLGVGASGLVARPIWADTEPPVGELPANAPMLDALRYVEASVTPGRECANCVLFQAGSAGRGKCSLFRDGSVNAKGWCSSWTPKA